MRGLVWLLIISVVSAAVVFWLFFAEDAPLPRPAPATPPQAAAPEPAPVIPPPEFATSDPAPAASDPPLIVDSFPQNSQPSTSGWVRVGEFGGYLDTVQRQKTGVAIEASASVAADDVLVAKGWAGDSSLGIRFPDVLLSMCNRFVARAQVSGSRPDVAKAVHPNLEASGWSAEIYVGDLPTCETPDLEAWAVVPGPRAALAPLLGKRRISVVPGAGAREHVSAQVPVDQGNYWPYKAVKITVTPSRANMRRCGSTSCPVVAQVDRGTYPAAILDQTEGWSLMVVGDRAGWLFDELYQTIP